MVMAVKLSELVALHGGACSVHAGASVDTELAEIELDSRRIAPGALFAALPGARVDGAGFVAQAIERGARAVLSPAPLGEVPAEGPWTNWVHPHARRIVGHAAKSIYGDPSAGLPVVGVTGTNGKTTVAHLVGQLLEHSGHSPAVFGTVDYRLARGELRVATHTTPDAPNLWRLLRDHVALGGDALVLEVSSHALVQERIAGLELDVAVFTNLGRDHLDYHGDSEAYASAKERLFEHLRPGGTAVINADDPAAQRMMRAARRSGARVVTYGIRSRADLRAELEHVVPTGAQLFLQGMGIPRTGLFLPLVGRHNVQNALAAEAAVLSLGASPARVLQGLAAVSPPRGRLERIDTGGRGFHAWVDYAHTPEALEHALSSLLETRAPGARLLCVFGCGGKRDQHKRALMGEVAARLADRCFVTSDNPRDEDPSAIMRDILQGMQAARTSPLAEPDRRRAIRSALGEARPGDVVLIAGKGHETWQWLRTERRPFDDRQVVREELP